MVSVAREAGRMILSANPTDIDQGTKLNCKSPTTNPATILHNIARSRLAARGRGNQAVQHPGGSAVSDAGLTPSGVGGQPPTS